MTAMEVGFTVSGAGPLSQISVQLFSAGTAIHLATGAYGWWKARERGLSLVDVLIGNGGTLACTSTFNRTRYQNRRRGETIKAVARQPGKLMSFMLPRASTAKSDDPGLECLRALVTCLLCFFDIETTTRILESVVPDLLINQEQDDKRVELEGPVFAAIVQYVQSVDTEEQGSSLRKELLERVDTQLDRVSGARGEDLLACDDNTTFKCGFVIGLLRWALLPAHKRERTCYPTRSLKIWALALVLSDLGFEVEPCLEAVSTKEEYKIQVEQHSHHISPLVILVTRQVGLTDPSAAVNIVTNRITKIRHVCIDSIPFIEFRHVAAFQGEATVESLSEIWRYSFFHGASFPKQAFMPSGTRPPGIVLDRELLDVVSLWTGDMQWLVSEPVKKYVCLQRYGPLPQLRQELERLKEECQRRGLKESGILDGVVSDMWHIMTAIVTATVLGACSTFLLNDGHAFDISAEIAIRPGFLYSMTPFNWIDILSQAAKFFLIQILLETVCGGGMNAQTLHEVRIAHGKGAYRILGAQLNGMTLMSDFLVNMFTSQPDVYHLQRGRLLDVPVNGYGFIRAGLEFPWSHMRSKYDSISSVRDTHRLVLLPDQASIRLDLEPDWKGNEQEVIFLIRREGLLRGAIDPIQLRSRLRAAEWICCSCGRHAKEKRIDRNVANDVPFESTTLSNILQTYQAYPIVRVAEECRAFVIGTCHGSDEVDNVSGLVALNMAYGGRGSRGVLTDCLECTYDHVWDENGQARDKRHHDKYGPVVTIVGVSTASCERAVRMGMPAGQKQT